LNDKKFVGIEELCAKLKENYVGRDNGATFLMNNKGSIFDKCYRKSSKNSDTTAEILMDYEEHYMRLVKNYRHEIEFINDLNTSHKCAGHYSRFVFVYFNT